MLLKFNKIYNAGVLENKKTSIGISDVFCYKK